MKKIPLIVSIVILLFAAGWTSVRASENLQDTTPEAPDYTSTPQEDGSIYHVVRYGESLTYIAELYGLSVEELMALNFLTDASIFEGQGLKIRGPQTATPTQVLTPTERPTRTPKPTRTPRPTMPPPTATDISNAPSPTPTPEPAPSVPKPYTQDPFFLGIVGLGTLGILLMIVGMVIRKAGK